MKPAKKLTEVQRKRLAVLEPKLKAAARLGQYDKAIAITADIQELLRPTGHEMRLQQVKLGFLKPRSTEATWRLPRPVSSGLGRKFRVGHVSTLRPQPC